MPVRAGEASVVLSSLPAGNADRVRDIVATNALVLDDPSDEGIDTMLGNLAEATRECVGLSEVISAVRTELSRYTDLPGECQSGSIERDVQRLFERRKYVASALAGLLTWDGPDGGEEPL